MSQLHEELKNKRLEKGITLKNIYDLTKIRVEILERIEKGDFNVAPRPYLRAFLREYADVVGIEPQRVLDVLDNKRSMIQDMEPVTVVQTDDAAVIDNSAAREPLDDTPLSSPKKITVETIDDKKLSPVESSNDAISTKETAAAPLIAVIESAENKTSAVHPDDIPEPIKHETPAEEIPAVVKIKKSAHKKTEKAQSHELQTSFFEGKNNRETTAGELPPVIDAIGDHVVGSVKPVVADAPESASTEKHKRLEFEEPSSGNTAFLIVFIILIVAAAAIIVWMNRTGMF